MSAKKMKPIQSYLEPAKEQEIVHVYVDRDLKEKVQKKLKNDGHKISDLVRAAFQQYLDSFEGGKK